MFFGVFIIVIECIFFMARASFHYRKNILKQVLNLKVFPLTVKKDLDSLFHIMSLMWMNDSNNLNQVYLIQLMQL